MAKAQFTAEQITAVIEKRGVSRAMAAQWLRRQAKKAAAMGLPSAQSEGAAEIAAAADGTGKQKAAALRAAAEANTPKASKPKREKTAARREGGKGSVSTGLIAPELREGVVKRMWGKHDAADIAVELGWTRGNGYSMVKRIAVGLGLRKK